MRGPLTQRTPMENGASYEIPLVFLISSSLQRPVKRTRTTPTKNRNRVRSGLSRRVLGRLSELPAMSLDILYEIFGHLPPSDLLSLSRVNKAFRHVLMSRRSLFLWKASFALIPDVPGCPEDMSEPAWAHLLFGGAYCYSCGAKPVTKILFSLRRRACKSCMRTHLLCASFLPKDFREMFSSIIVNSGSNFHQLRPWCTEHLWDEDVKAFHSEICAIEPRVLGTGSISDTEAILNEFLERRKKSAAYIKEHTLICVAWEKGRNADRSAVLSDVKAKRFEEIKKRFIKLGYIEDDVNRIRWHREVSTSKPMSDRGEPDSVPELSHLTCAELVWQRIEPLLIPEINKSRDLRLRSTGERYTRRREFVASQFANVVKTLSPLLLGLSPTFMEFLCASRTLANAVALDSDPDNSALGEQTREAISKLAQELETRRQERTDLLRSLLPKDIVSKYATDDEALSLATSVYECLSCHQILSGLHMLAHRCYGPQKSRGQSPQFSEKGRETVVALLSLIGLGRETTALELDRRSDKFVCMWCPLTSYLGDETFSQRRPVRDWRSCVIHALAKEHEDKDTSASIPRWIVVGETETAGLHWDGDAIFGAYSCMHCPPRLERRYGYIEWRGLEAVKEHTRVEHNKEMPASQ
ncbi:hypothetical protein B0F90DRAFT_372221 [Multifurca ochricompacta]|uniref:F-box domain-containing protein n=1 Tax=Multifurca ochricompacta TaxID=376703 RepID=A0AAD4QKY0_9AGAM|nr:hypothetical protein B0F90DRAFT_372221 [Multifurca ochricompacta]